MWILVTSKMSRAADIVNYTGRGINLHFNERGTLIRAKLVNKEMNIVEKRIVAQVNGVENWGATESELSLPASGSFIFKNQSFKFRRKKIRNRKIKIFEMSRRCLWNSPANGTVCMSDFEGCGAVEYMYLNSWSTWLLAMPPPRSEIFTEMSSFPLAIVTLIGGIFPLSWCVSITALIEFLNNSKRMW